MSQNFKEINDLIEKLCKHLVGSSKQKEALKHVTQYFSTAPNSFNTSSHYDETYLVSKIANHIRRSRNKSDVGLFLSLHEQLKACQIESKKRSALLTFLYFMADSPTSKIRVSSNGAQFNASGSILTSTKTSSMYQTLRDASEGPSTSLVPKDESTLKLATVRTIQLRTNSDSDVSNQSSGTTLDKIDSSEILENQTRDLSDDTVQNCIYSFTGIQGKFLKKDVNGNFKLDPKESRKLNITQAGMLLRLSEIGYYHDLVEGYSNPKSGKTALGLMGQGFVSALQAELTTYYGMVAILQDHYNRQRKLSLSDWKQCPEKLTLVKLLVWSGEPLHRLQWLATIAEACQEKKGGVLASTVYKFFSKGDPVIKSLVTDLLLAICGPLQQMMSRWLMEGEIIDPHGEFFIDVVHEVGNENLWKEKYLIKESMLPVFMSHNMVNKILGTGKCINFLREICNDKSVIKGKEELKEYLESESEHIFSILEDTKLHSLIESVYLSTSKRVLDIMMVTHRLMDHMHVIRRYILFGKGDFILILIENLKSKLDRPASELVRYELTSILDASLRSTCTSQQESTLCENLEFKMYTPLAGDSSWEIVALFYNVKGPLATILSSNNDISNIFKTLWRIKHMDFLLSKRIWISQIANAKLLRPLSKQLNPIMYRLHFLTSEMIHFINQMQYYILFEVIECSWVQFQESVESAKTLDEVIKAHDIFLKTIKIGAFIENQSYLENMQHVYTAIRRLDAWQVKFFELCFQEMDAINSLKKQIKESESKGEYGLTADRRLQRDMETKNFEVNLISAKKNLDKIAYDYELAVKQFLLTLNSSQDQNLLLFGIRLDFNEFYKKKDQRLCVPLTFEHMRLSNVMYKSGYGNQSFFTFN